ncbi:ESCRT-III subunit protein snf7 [Tulasnella sp. 332]|nr:ESCRT-III subunit protein snf7 [Tulasnella sp. 332]
MFGWMPHFEWRRDPHATIQEAMVALRQQIQRLEKKEEYVIKKVDEETEKAEMDRMIDKSAALSASRRKEQLLVELDRLRGMRLALETQVNAIENAITNYSTMAAMKKGASASKIIRWRKSL